MDFKQTLHQMIDELYDEAVSDFKQTELHAVASIPIDELNLFEFSEKQREYIRECISAYQSFYYQEEKHVYKQGIRDGITLIKSLELLY